ncbi:MAG: alpha/beta hydrolase [Candidatus Bathyarchaeia archaeon]
MISCAINVELPTKVTLQYVEQGSSSGYPLILLHGYADSWRSFGRVLSYLPTSIRAFALTQRGHGDASRPLTGYTPREFAMDLAAFMDALHLEAAVIAGGSSGGVVARRFAIDHPQRTAGLILVGSPLTLRDKPGVREMWDSTISKLRDPIDPEFVREFAESQLAQQVPQAFLRTVVEESLKVPARVWRATLEGLLEDDSSEELDKITAPTLIIWGDKDTIIPRSDQETLVERIAGSRLVAYPGAGHAPYWEEPAHFASDIEAFIEELAHRTRSEPKHGSAKCDLHRLD